MHRKQIDVCQPNLGQTDMDQIAWAGVGRASGQRAGRVGLAAVTAVLLSGTALPALAQSPYYGAPLPHPGTVAAPYGNDFRPFGPPGVMPGGGMTNQTAPRPMAAGALYAAPAPLIAQADPYGLRLANPMPVRRGRPAPSPFAPAVAPPGLTGSAGAGDRMQLSQVPFGGPSDRVARHFLSHQVEPRYVARAAQLMTLYSPYWSPLSPGSLATAGPYQPHAVAIARGAGVGLIPLPGAAGPLPPPAQKPRSRLDIGTLPGALPGAPVVSGVTGPGAIPRSHTAFVPRGGAARRAANRGAPLGWLGAPTAWSGGPIVINSATIGTTQLAGNPGGIPVVINSASAPAAAAPTTTARSAPTAPRPEPEPERRDRAPVAPAPQPPSAPQPAQQAPSPTPAGRAEDAPTEREMTGQLDPRDRETTTFATSGPQPEAPAPAAPAAEGGEQRVTIQPSPAPLEVPSPAAEAPAAAPVEQQAALPPAAEIAAAPIPNSLGGPDGGRVTFAEEELDVLTDDDRVALDAIVDAFEQNRDIRIELWAYARGSEEDVNKARRVALSRGLAVRSYLVDNEVPAPRIDMRVRGPEAEEGYPDRVDIVIVR